MTAALAWFQREHGRQRIVAMIAPGNAASVALAGRLRFTFLRDATLPGGEAVHLFERPAAAR
jgi:RimJ/RimL family protein N-acetyltransferase